MPEAVRFVTRKKKKLGFSVRFELEIKGRKSAFVIGEFYNKIEQKPLHRNKPTVIGYIVCRHCYQRIGRRVVWIGFVSLSR